MTTKQSGYRVFFVYPVISNHPQKKQEAETGIYSATCLPVVQTNREKTGVTLSGLVGLYYNFKNVIRTM